MPHADGGSEDDETGSASTTGSVHRGPWGPSGWDEAEPEKLGFDRQMLERADTLVPELAPHIQSTVVVRHGVIVWERYYGGYCADIDWLQREGPLYSAEPYPAAFDLTQVHNVKSVTKCFTSALLGIAVGDGLIDLDARIGDLLADRFVGGVDPAKKQITVRHLITMRSGLEWVENGSITLDWARSGDLVRFSLSRQRLVDVPGSTWRYSTADTQLLAACLATAVGGNLLTFADNKLFGPLGFSHHRWGAEPNGLNIGGSELCLTPRDMARFGLLFLRDGLWGDLRLVDEAWVTLSTAGQSDVDAETIRHGLPLTDESLPEQDPYRNGYGYAWWRTALAEHPVYYAAGYGGQIITVVEDLDLVVVQTAAIDVPADELPPRSRAQMRLLDELIIPAAEPAQS